MAATHCLKALVVSLCSSETLQLHTPLLLKGPLPAVIAQAMLTLMCMLPLSCRMIIMGFHKWFSFILAHMVIITPCILRVLYYLGCGML